MGNPQHVIIYGPQEWEGSSCKGGAGGGQKTPFTLAHDVPLWKWMPPPPVLTRALLIPCWVLCMIPSIKVRGPWAWQGFLSPNQAQ